MLFEFVVYKKCITNNLGVYFLSLQREVKDRSKAYLESRKTGKPLWEEDGINRSILDKYDEEEEESLQLNDYGAIGAAKSKRQEDVRTKLAAAAAAVNAGIPLGAADHAPAGGGNGDYYTLEEIEAMKKPKKKKQRKLKKKAMTDDDLVFLETEAAAAHGRDSDLGSRADRQRRAAQLSDDLAREQAGNRARFDAALSKANYASLALRPDAVHGNGIDDDDDEQDADLYRSLNKARELAHNKKQGGTAPPLESIAEQLAKRREASKGNAVELNPVGLTFTDIGEFSRAIRVKEAVADAAAKAEAATVVIVEDHVRGKAESESREAEEKVEPMEEDTQVNEPPNSESVEVNPEEGGGWMSAAAAAQEANEAAEKKRTHRRRRRREEEEEGGAPGGDSVGGGSLSVTAESSIGSGLAGALAFLKGRGDLERPVEWSGRTNDSRDSYFTAAMGGYKDVYSGGRTEDKLALDVEVALTRKDEYGRILTPKEAFRQLCHSFHGIKPSLNTREKRAKQVAKELAQRRTATGAAEGEVMAGLKAVQTQAATPYMVLSGNVKPGQSRDAANGYATVDRAEALTQPGAGGGRGSSMPPPPPKGRRD